MRGGVGVAGSACARAAVKPGHRLAEAQQGPSPCLTALIPLPSSRWAPAQVWRSLGSGRGGESGWASRPSGGSRPH